MTYINFMVEMSLAFPRIDVLNYFYYVEKPVPVRNPNVDHVYQAVEMQADHTMVKRMAYVANFINNYVSNIQDLVLYKILMH